MGRVGRLALSPNFAGFLQEPIPTRLEGTMYYFKIHIGDYAKKTGHLSPLEHGIYLLILHAYYDRELAPTLLDATRWARARTEEEKQAVTGVLNEFFEVKGDRYIHHRVEEELESYQNKAEANRAIALARESNKRARKEHETCTKRAKSVNETCTIGSPQEQESSTTEQPNHKPLTTNHKPIEKQSAPAAADAELFPGVDAQVIDDFKKLRKQKRAAVTMTAMLSIQKEAAKAGLSLNDALLLCCARGWQGFNADWVTGQAASVKSNLHVNHLDHSSSRRAMEESMRKHGITEIPEGEIEL